jgi:hypothetical protein
MGLFDTGYDLGSGLGDSGSGAVDMYATATPDYSTPYPASVLDGGSSGGISDAWDKLFQGSVAKGLDYFIAKDAAVTRAGLPGGYPGTYFRGADGRLYQSNGMPVGGVAMQGQASGNGLLLIGLAVVAGLLLKG